MQHTRSADGLLPICCSLCFTFASSFFLVFAFCHSYFVALVCVSAFGGSAVAAAVSTDCCSCSCRPAGGHTTHHRTPLFALYTPYFCCSAFVYISVLGAWRLWPASSMNSVFSALLVRSAFGAANMDNSSPWHFGALSGEWCCWTHVLRLPQCVCVD